MAMQVKTCPFPFRVYGSILQTHSQNCRNLGVAEMLIEELDVFCLLT